MVRTYMYFYSADNEESGQYDEDYPIISVGQLFMFQNKTYAVTNSLIDLSNDVQYVNCKVV